MKWFNKLKAFIHNVSSGDYDHATRSMNEFLATGKFPEEAEVVKPEYVEVEIVEIPDQVITSDTVELTKLQHDVLNQAAENKKVKIK